MKNILFIVTLLLGVNNLIQADMLVSKKDSVVRADSMEVEIMHFSDAEIIRIIKESKILNPRIKNLSIIKTTDTVVLKINDSLAYSFSPSKGGSCWKQLSRGIKRADLFPFSLYEDIKTEEPAIVDPLFLDKLDSIYGNVTALLFVDSNLAKDRPSITVVSDSVKNESSFDSSVFRGNDKLSSKKYEYDYSYYNDDKKININFAKVLGRIIFFSIFIVAIVYGYNDYKKNRPYNYRREEKKREKAQKNKDVFG